MSDTLETINRKINAAGELKSVVRMLKAMASSNINQYSIAEKALSGYYETISLGLFAFLKKEGFIAKENNKSKDKHVIAIIFGSDLGLVGRFNDSITDFAMKTLKSIEGKKKIWSVGERVQLLLADKGIGTSEFFPVPDSVTAITPLVGQLLIKSEQYREEGIMDELFIFHNQRNASAGYQPIFQRLLPLDEKWMENIKQNKWPTKNIPELIGKRQVILLALVREYIFVSLFSGCAESQASENATRLVAMQRAEKNIDKLLEHLNLNFHHIRQASIDEELFDLIAGFEALTI